MKLVKLPRPKADSIYDLFFFTGLATFAWGLYLIYPPAAWIGAGVILMLIGGWAAKGG